MRICSAALVFWLLASGISPAQGGCRDAVALIDLGVLARRCGRVLQPKRPLFATDIGSTLSFGDPSEQSKSSSRRILLDRFGRDTCGMIVAGISFYRPAIAEAAVDNARAQLKNPSLPSKSRRVGGLVSKIRGIGTVLVRSFARRRIGCRMGLLPAIFFLGIGRAPA
jgi:hypothetical protein